MKVFNGPEFGVCSFLSDAQLDSRQLLPVLLNTPKLGFAIVDRQMRYQAVNRLISDANGISPEGHLGKTIFEILGKGAEKVAGPLRYAFTSDDSFHSFEVATDPGRLPIVRRWQINFFPIRSSTGSVVQVATTALEIIGTQQPVDPTASRLLTVREKQVIKGIANGKVNKEIAFDLNLSTRTVETYRARIMYKLQTHSVAGIVMYAVRNNLI